jgi:hypothetical protein
MIFEYTTSYQSNKLSVKTNQTFKGRGIQLISNGDSNARGLKTYLMTENAFNKVAPKTAVYR